VQPAVIYGPWGSRQDHHCQKCSQRSGRGYSTTIKKDKWPFVPKRDGTAAIAVYLAVVRKIMPFNQGTLKSTISKVGGTTKITVDFLGKKKGAVEIPRTIIEGELLFICLSSYSLVCNHHC